MTDSVRSGSFTAVGVSASISVPAGGQVAIMLFGTYSANLELHRSDNGAAWVKIRDLNDGTVKIFSTATSSSFYRIVCTSFTSGQVDYELVGARETMYFPQPQWDDIRFPASGINPPGAVSDPDRDTDDGLLRFDPASTEVIAIQVIFPHSHKHGTLIRPHVHWMKTTDAAGDVVWKLEWKAADPNETFPGWQSQTVSETVSGTPGGAHQNHVISEFAPISLNATGVAPALLMKLSRVGGDAADTYGADAKLIEFDIHHLIDTWGSGGEFIK